MGVVELVYRVGWLRAKVLLPQVQLCDRGLERYDASLSMWSTILLALNLTTMLILVAE